MINNSLMLESACDFYCTRYLDIISSEIAVINSCAEYSSDITESLHQMRTSSRRVMAVISAKNRFLNHHSGKSLEKLMRQLLKSSGRLRDLDVLIANVNELLNSGLDRRCSEDLSAYHQWLRQKREKGWPALHGSLSNSYDSRLASVMEELRARSCMGHDDKSGDGYKLTEAAPAMFYAAAADIIAVGRAGNKLHELRINCKGFRYLLELFELAGIDSSRQQNEFKEIQDIFGRWHDDQVLLSQLKKFSRSEYITEHAHLLKQYLSEREQLSRRRAEEAARVLEQGWFDSAFAGMFLS